MRVNPNKIEDTTKTNNIITNQNIYGKSIFEVYSEKLTIEIDYIYNGTSEEPDSGGNNQNPEQDDNSGENENTGNENNNDGNGDDEGVDNLTPEEGTDTSEDEKNTE